MCLKKVIWLKAQVNHFSFSLDCLQYFVLIYMQGQNKADKFWQSKPKYCSHNFRKFKRGSDQNKETVTIKSIKVAKQSVGVIRATWKTQSHYRNCTAVSGFIFGTGFMVSKNILMTCAHNIYSKSKKSFANYVQFIPGIQEGRPQNNNFIIRTATLSSKHPRNFVTLYSKDFVNDSNSELEPCLQEICLIFLDQVNEGQTEKIIPNQFLKIGNLDESKHPLKLKIFGYPSDKFKSQTKFQKAYVERVEMNGILYSIGSFQTQTNLNNSSKNIKNNRELTIIDQIINHTMKTKIGCSGSPILTANNYGQLYIVGIHTHRGREDDYNSGVYFGTHIIKLIKQLENKLREQFKTKQFNLNNEHIGQQDEYRKQEIILSKIEEDDYTQSQSSQNLPEYNKKKSSDSPQQSEDSIESFQNSKIQYQYMPYSEPKEQEREVEGSCKDRSGGEADSQYSSCIDEDYIQDFYKFLAIQKVSSQSKYQSQDYSPQASRRVLISLITIYYMPNSRFLLPHQHQPNTSDNVRKYEDEKIFSFAKYSNIEVILLRRNGVVNSLEIVTKNSRMGPKAKYRQKSRYISSGYF